VPDPSAPVPKAIVVPHAGLQYSGPIAASAYLRLEPAHADIHRVVLLGPSHRVPLRGLAAPSADVFITPLGPVTVDDELRRSVLELDAVTVDDQAHRYEHSLEVQLPFLQTMLDDFTLLPLVVGDATTDEVARTLDRCWGGAETLIVISTDLSHYHDHDRAVRLDRATAAEILASNPEGITDVDACGARPLRGLLAVARTRDLAVEQLDLRTSGDTAGDRERVVGYGAFAFD
jgi:AmmeMemoRadiSam system protein B